MVLLVKKVNTHAYGNMKNIIDPAGLLAKMNKARKRCKISQTHRLL